MITATAAESSIYNVASDVIIIYVAEANQSGGSTATSGSSGQRNSGGPIITVDGKSYTDLAVTDSNTKSDGSNITTVSVKTDAVLNYIETGENKGSVDIIVNTEEAKATTLQVDITVELEEKLTEKNKDLVITTGGVKYTIAAGNVDTKTVMKNFDDGVTSDKVKLTLTVTPKSGDEAKKAGYTVEGTPLEFELKATDGNKTVTISNFNHYVSRDIRLDTGLDPSKVTTAITQNSDGTWRHIPTYVYKGSDGYYYAKINSLTNSVYVLINNEVGFADAKGKWYENAVTEMASREILRGYSDGGFYGDRNISRAEFAAIVVRALGLPTFSNAAHVFTDVRDGDWYYGVLGTAYEQGIICGRSTTIFDPFANITREEAMVMIQRACKITGLPKGNNNYASLTGLSEVSTWATNAVIYNLETGLIQGRNSGDIDAKSNISRGETATVILRMMQKSILFDIRAIV